MDMHSLVPAVISAFEDAANLVRRIQEKRDASTAPALPEEPTTDLLNSLSLGPVIVRGHYDHDLKRFGEPYACGDPQAREQMKDVLISLQMALIMNLNKVWMDEGHIDYNALQTVSDDSRVNAGVCLGQLSQRLSDAAKAQSMYSQQQGTYGQGSSLTPMSPSLQYSSSRSTQSSTFSRSNNMTPNTAADDLGNMKLSPGLTGFPRSSAKERNTSNSSTGSQTQTSPWISNPQRSPPNPSLNRERHSNSDITSLRRPSSHTLAPEDNLLLSPTTYDKSPQSSPRQNFVGPNQEDHISRTSSNHHSTGSGDGSIERYGPDDFKDHHQQRISGNEFGYATIYDHHRLSSAAPAPTSLKWRTPNDGEDYSTLEHVQYLRQNSRPPVPDTGRIVRANSSTPLFQPLQSQNPNLEGNNTALNQQQLLRDSNPRPSISAPIRVPVPGPVSGDQSHIHPALRTQPQIQPQIQSSLSISSLSSRPTLLTLPTEKNTLGLCRGAFRLFIGLERKAFAVNNRPVGISGLIPYWKCEKCTFEGVCVITHNNGNSNGSGGSILGGGRGSNSKKMKAEKIFDPQVREVDGILYRWQFLAKCHVAIKSLPEGIGARDGSFGSFGCVFCAVEGAGRGWDTGASETGSVSGNRRKGSEAEAGTPIFGNLQSFMGHLQLHRREEMWPGVEMRGRMNVLVGRRAEVGELFDVCFTPL